MKIQKKGDSHFGNRFWNRAQCAAYGNAFRKIDLNIHYKGVEAYPVAPEEIAQLNYITQLERPDYTVFFNRCMIAPGVKKHFVGSFLFIQAEGAFSRFAGRK